MAFGLLNNEAVKKDLYKCLSTDTKPTTDIAGGALAYETDTSDVYEFDGAAWVLIRTTDSSGNPAGNTLNESSGLQAGEEGFASPELGRTRINNPCHVTKLASSASAQHIGGAQAVPVYIKGIYVMQALTGSATVTIAGLSTPTAVAALGTTYVWTDGDHFTTADNVAYPINILPSGGAAMAFPAGCSLTCSTAGDGLKIIVLWEPMP